jgi:uncharacterized membrane protein (DUF2068 family)
MKSNAHPHHHDVGLVLIAILKLVNGLLLVALGIGVLSLFHKDLTALVTYWADVLEISSENQLLQKLLEKAGLIRTNHLVWVSAITFVYAALMFTMGTGLLLEKRWAEYLTAIVTASFIPFEIYELVRHIRSTTIIVLAINVASVIYLVWKLMHRTSTSRTSPGPSAPPCLTSL